MSPKPLSHAIQCARATRGLSQVDLASRIGVTQAAVSFWEHGKDVPSFLHILKLLLCLPELRRNFPPEYDEVLARIQTSVASSACTCANCSCNEAEQKA